MMHTVTKAITENIRDPELMVNSFRAMFGKQSVEFYVEQRRKMAEADNRDGDLMYEAQEFPRWQEVGGELVRGLPLDYDPTPYCLHCGPKSACDCGPIADNE